MNYDYKHIKNITLAGAAGSGKTSLFEAFLYSLGKTDRMGTVGAGNTVSDYTAEEIKRGSSVNLAMAVLENNGFKYNLIDTPGSFDFEGEEIEGISAADTCIITVSAKSGVKVGTHKAYDLCKAAGKPNMFVVTKIDDDKANFNNVLTQLKAEFGPSVCPVVVPVIANNNIVSYVNLIEMKAYEYNDKGEAVEIEMPTSEVSEKMGYRIDGLVEAVSEAVAETDEALFEKFFSGEPFTQDEIIEGIHKGVKNGIITPVTCVSSLKIAGVDMLLKEMELMLPDHSEDDTVTAETPDGDIAELRPAAENKLCAFVFKTVNDPYIGKMSYVKVLSGKISQGDDLFIAENGTTVKAGKTVTLCGKKQIDVPEIAAGDIGVLLKTDVRTNMTLSSQAAPLLLETMVFPEANYRLAVRPANQGDEGKIASAITKICEEDLTFTYTTDETTNEQIIAGLGEQHLLSKLARLSETFGTEAETSLPKIAYKETIRKKVKVQGRHKKQSGGHGQYGDVWIEFEPSFTDGLVFEERVVGGAVPKNFFPAIEKGLNESMAAGVLGGFPVVGIKAILVDGSYHPVDSSEMAFKIAASLAYKEGMKQADPVLLEPIGTLRVLVPDTSTGDIIGDLNKRRGRIMGMDAAEKKGCTVVEAEVPIREMSDFTTVLRSMTQGSGSYTLRMERYDQLPQQLLKDVLLEANN